MENSTKHNASLGLIALTIILSIVAFSGANGDVAWSNFEYSGEKSGSGCFFDSEVRLGLMAYQTVYPDFDSSSPCTSLSGEKKQYEYSSENTATSNDGCIPYTAPGGTESDATKRKKEFCNTCDSSGKAVLSMMVFGLIAAMGAVSMVWARKQGNSVAGGSKRLAALACCAAMAVFALISWSAWTGCTEAANTYAKEVNDDYKAVNGAGFGILIVATCSSIAACVFQFLVDSAAQ